MTRTFTGEAFVHRSALSGGWRKKKDIRIKCVTKDALTCLFSEGGADLHGDNADTEGTQEFATTAIFRFFLLFMRISSSFITLNNMGTDEWFDFKDGLVAALLGLTLKLRKS